MTPSNKVLEVLLFYDVDTIWPDNSMQRVKQRVQLSWVVEGGSHSSACVTFPMHSITMTAM